MNSIDEKQKEIFEKIFNYLCEHSLSNEFSVRTGCDNTIQLFKDNEKLLYIEINSYGDVMVVHSNVLETGFRLNKELHYYPIDNVESIIEFVYEFN